MTTSAGVESPLQSESMQLKDFHYDLPESRIADFPVSPRDNSKLMVIHRDTDVIEHKIFRDIIDYFNSGDVLVLNQTKVFPARIFAEKEHTGARVEIFLLRELEKDIWEVLINPARKVRVGTTLNIADGVSCDVIDNTISGGRVVRFWHDKDDFHNFLDSVGEAPLPPYIKREALPEDKETYQTVYAKEPGAVAAPTAGLHFTDSLMESLKQKGVKIATVTLHIGLGTFRPVTVNDPSRHDMHSENYRIAEEEAHIINQAHDRGKKVVAVGTSSVRVLETACGKDRRVAPAEGWTDLFIYPPYDFKIVDGMITNFHQPESTLIMLVSAFYTREKILTAYETALKNDYRFLSYGDAMLIL